MILLKNKRAWLAWSKEKAKSQGCGVTEPKSYPCYAQFVCVSYGMEWDDGQYFYYQDLFLMCLKLGEESGLIEHGAQLDL